MEFVPSDTVLSVWTATLNAEKAGRCGDWMLFTKRTAEGLFCGEYRFRYSNGPGFCDADEISRYVLGPAPDSEDIRAHMRNVTSVLQATGFLVDVKEHPVNGDFRKLIDVLMNLPGWDTKLTRATDLGEL